MSEFALTRYDAACRAVAEAKTVDEVKNIRDTAIAMKAYARQAKNREMESDAVGIRMRAERRVGQLMNGQKKTVGLATGGGGRDSTGVRKTPVDAKPTLAEAGIDKNLAKNARKLARLDAKTFEQVVSDTQEAVKTVVAKTVNATLARVVKHRVTSTTTENISLEAWNKLPEGERHSLLTEPPAKVGSFNRQDTTAIEWAQFSWNPITGCLHDCPYCYARDIATSSRTASAFPNGFTPTIRPASLFKPRGMVPPGESATDTRFRNVFTCSMADLFGRWVPREWIEAVLREMRSAPNWNFLCLTKFPKRMAEFDIPANAWMGTTVDLQARIPNAEAAFANVNSGVRWLSVEPMLEPLKFRRLERFNWIVIGGSTRSTQTPAFIPPIEWVVDLVVQARAAGLKIYMKTNLGIENRLLELPFDAPIGDLFDQVAPPPLQYLKRARDGEAA
jgi:protein gp37